MKSRKESRKGKSRKKSPPGILFAVIIIVSILFIYYLLFTYSTPSNETFSLPFQFKAAIVDHLSLTAPNQTFIQTARTILETANYTVDYYPGEKVDVKFYRNLPTHGYDVIILRAHSALESYEKVSPVVLFTSESYGSTKYVNEQFPLPPQKPRLGAVAYTIEEKDKGIWYFGILPPFVEHSMKGTFNNTVIIMMGCDGLRYETMAEAFVKKGAKVYISWDRGVSASHTDLATIQLLEHLIIERKTIKQAVTETMKEVGPDPFDKSILLYYPTTPETEDYVIPEPKSNITTNVAEINPKVRKLKRRSIIMAKTL